MDRTRPASFVVAAAVLALAAPPAAGQVVQVTVGVTPNCPYGLPACWSGARPALLGLDGVVSVTTVPDGYNCTADVRFKGKGLPDVAAWDLRFRAAVGGTHRLRGVELTVEGVARPAAGAVLLDVPGLADPLPLAPLEHKLQWNVGKRAARQPEPDEKAAYQTLAAALARRGPGTGPLTVRATGPLHGTGRDRRLELREFFTAEPEPTGGRP